jgi:hypothetical protein
LGSDRYCETNGGPDTNLSPRSKNCMFWPEGHFRGNCACKLVPDVWRHRKRTEDLKLIAPYCLRLQKPNSGVLHDCCLTRGCKRQFFQVTVIWKKAFSNLEKNLSRICPNPYRKDNKSCYILIYIRVWILQVSNLLSCKCITSCFSF